jgi:hypothetical protein
MVLKSRLGKGAQKSNWGFYRLHQHQILYVENDAHSAICVKNLLGENELFRNIALPS